MYTPPVLMSSTTKAYCRQGEKSSPLQAYCCPREESSPLRVGYSLLVNGSSYNETSPLMIGYPPLVVVLSEDISALESQLVGSCGDISFRGFRLCQAFSPLEISLFKEVHLSE